MATTIQYLLSQVLDAPYEDPDKHVYIDTGTKIEPGALIFENVSIGRDSIIGPYVILKPGTKIGSHTIIGSATVTEGNCIVGNHTTVHAQCHLTQGLDIGNRCFIAPFFCAANTPKISVGPNVKFGYPNSTNDKREPVIIKDGVVMGVNVQIAPGVTVNEEASIGMNCLILKDVPKGQFIKAGSTWKGVV